jgi:L-aspartate oxidase
MNVEVLIIGGGVAGLTAALSLAPRKVTLVVPEFTASSSFWAQGGIAASVGSDDSPYLHQEDSERAGDSLVDEQVAYEVTQEAPKVISWLSELGVPFDRNESNEFLLGLEGAHSKRRILHVEGDQIGKGLINTLKNKVERAPHVQIVFGTLESVLRNSYQELAGATIKIGNRTLEIYSGFTIFATGGIGGLFSESTTPRSNSGVALTVAALLGAELIDLEFIQFHPTALDVPGAKRKPLLTEALRGEGAVIRNHKGDRFIDELAPRHIVAREIFKHTREGKRVFLDISKVPNLEINFPQAVSIATEFGFDPYKDYLPIVPACHYHMGGVRTSLSGISSIPRFFVVGEAACTGLHGANRLASNSLLEAMVMGRRAGELIKDSELEMSVPSSVERLKIKYGSDEEKDQIATINSRCLGIIRDGKTLEEGLNQITGDSAEATASRLIYQSAILREESRGSHFRSDYPLKRARPYRISVSKLGGEIESFKLSEEFSDS